VAPPAFGGSATRIAGAAAACFTAGMACGPASPPANAPALAPVTATVAVAPRDLGAMAEGDCSVSTFLSGLGASTCTVVVPKQVVSNGSNATAAAVADGDACSVWSSGGLTPQTVEMDFGSTIPISALLVIPEMTPPQGPTQHEVELLDVQGNTRERASVSGPMIDQHGYGIQLPSPVQARFLRITTKEAPGYVAWREVAPLSCK
jgi:hypothetical protein